MNEPQLSAEMEKRFNEAFPNEESGYLNKQGKYVHLFNPAVDTREIKTFLATALEEQRMKTEVETGLHAFGVTMEEIAKARATELAKVLSEVEEGLSMLTRYLRSIYRLDHSDGEPPQQMLLEDDVMSVLNQLKEGK